MRSKWGVLFHPGTGQTVTTNIPQSLANQLWYRAGKLDGIGPAYYANEEQLDAINSLMDGIRLWP